MFQRLYHEVRFDGNTTLYSMEKVRNMCKCFDAHACGACCNLNYISGQRTLTLQYIRLAMDTNTFVTSERNSARTCVPSTWRHCKGFRSTNPRLLTTQIHEMKFVEELKKRYVHTVCAPPEFFSPRSPPVELLNPDP